MKIKIFTKFLCAFLFIAGMGMSNIAYSQTIVQWYTSMGDFRAELREDLVPMTAQNFIDLSNANFYDDLIFHRVISGFMNQDGCPNGNGTGGPGYTFDDEFHPDLRHDEPGILSMANSGPNTNGSQYFITVAPTTWLNDLHAVFGKIIDGMDVVYAISEVATDGNDKPLIDIVIDSIRVVTGDPALAITSPTEGTKWNGFVNNEITWGSEFVADVKIEFSPDNGQSWTNIVESTSANTRSYTWPAPGITSMECLLKVSDVAHPDIFDITGSPFTLCKLDLTHPSGFGYARIGSPFEIAWVSELVEDLTLEYKTSHNGEWLLIEQGVPASNGSYNWIPEEAASWCKIRISETGYPEVSDETDNFFIVFRLDLTSPLGGETLTGDDPFDITWESEIISSVRIEFSSDNGQSWTTVINSTPAGNTPYNWLVPNINSDQCFLKMTIPNIPDLYSMNESPFSIQEVTGISEQSEIDVKELLITPNPVTDQAAITVLNPEKWTGNVQLEIFNTKGDQVYEQLLGQISQKNQNTKLNLKRLPNGMYFLKLSANTTSSSIKFIKK